MQTTYMPRVSTPFALPTGSLPAPIDQLTRIENAVTSLQRDSFAMARAPRGELADLGVTLAAGGGGIAMLAALPGALAALCGEHALASAFFGVAATGCIGLLAAIGMDALSKRLTELRLVRAHGHNVLALEAEATSAKGVDLAWLALRAQSIVDCLGVPSDELVVLPRKLIAPMSKRPTAQRLQAIANLITRTTPAQQKIARKAFEVFKDVDAVNSHAHENMGILVMRIRCMSEEGRRLLRHSIREPILERLAKTPDPAWGRAMFLEAIDGKG